MITIKNTQRTIKIPATHVKKIITQILEKLGYQNFDIGIWFTTNKTIKKYNKQYRKNDKPTDILSFAYHADATPEQKIKVATPEDANLGDLIISAEYIARTARSFDTPFNEHLDMILVHGICHLIGHDHESTRDYQKMARLENNLKLLLSHK